MGIVSFGALSVGCFSSGALAIGRYIAVGDHSHAMIAIGESVAKGSYSHIGDPTTANMTTVTDLLDTNVPSWLSLGKMIFKLYLL